ncbi:MAG: hypothetical protein VXZ24_02820 [Pseudomonadota bacterium]|nr:hypothetical protein [Pseudomonadota bacterium]
MGRINKLMNNPYLILSVLVLIVSGNVQSEDEFTMVESGVVDMPYNTYCDQNRTIVLGKTRINISHCIDYTGPDGDGKYQSYYDYETIIFEMDGETVRVRRYKDTPEEASLLRISDSLGSRLLQLEDFDRNIIKTAVSFLVNSGAENVMYLDEANQASGYSQVPQDENGKLILDHYE